MCLCEFVIISIRAGRSEVYRFAGKQNGKFARITKASNHSGFAGCCYSCEHLGSLWGLTWVQQSSWSTTQCPKPQKLFALTVVSHIFTRILRSFFLSMALDTLNYIKKLNWVLTSKRWVQVSLNAATVSKFWQMLDEKSQWSYDWREAGW